MTRSGEQWFCDQYDRIFPFRPATLAFLAERLPQRGRVLDVGCGPGVYAAELAASGREVIGIDVDPRMIVRARREHPAATFQQLDMVAVNRLRCRFAGAYSLGNTMAFLAPDDWPRFLARLFDRLEPGAIWIFQTVNFDPLLGRDRHLLPPLGLLCNL